MKKSIPKPVIVLAIIACLLSGLFLCRKQIVQDDDVFAGIELSEETKARIERAKEKGDPTLIISNVEAKKGDTAVVTVSLVNNPGIIGLSMTLSYDENAVDLEKIKNGDAFDGVLDMNVSEDLSSGCSFMWDATDVSVEDIQDGVVLALQFRLCKDAPTGKTPVIMICDLEGAFDRDISVVDLTVENGYVTVIS